jgi:hypothetical protein
MLPREEFELLLRGFGCRMISVSRASLLRNIGRSGSAGTLPLSAFAGTTVDSVTLPNTGSTPTWLVPTQTSRVSASQASSLPAMFDFGPYPGDPDIGQ